MDAGSECFVEFAHAVGGQDDDSRKVFENSEKDFRTLSIWSNCVETQAKTYLRRDRSS